MLTWMDWSQNQSSYTSHQRDNLRIQNTVAKVLHFQGFSGESCVCQVAELSNSLLRCVKDNIRRTGFENLIILGKPCAMNSKTGF